jgi:cleavage and polyadenylation specificity factor subunit 3
MNRLRGAMTTRYKDRGTNLKIYTPRNLETLELSFRRDHVAKVSFCFIFIAFARSHLLCQVVGTLAEKVPGEGDSLSGLVVARNHSFTLLDAGDLQDLAGLPTSILTQKQRMALDVGWELVRWHLEGMFGKIEDGRDKDGVRMMRVRKIAQALSDKYVDDD